MKILKFANYKGDPWTAALTEQAEENPWAGLVAVHNNESTLVTSDILGQDEIDALRRGMNVYNKTTDKFKFVNIGLKDSEGTELYEGDHLWCEYCISNNEGTTAFRRGVIRYQAPSFVVMVDSQEGLVPFNFNTLTSFKKIQPVNF